LTAFKYAAQRGNDVRIIIPAIPDKKITYDIARTYYPSLLLAGVKIYEYTPGFIHAKTLVSDDNKAVVGSINFDYRSLYHHYECGVYFYQDPIVAEIEDDFQRTMAVSREVSLEYYRSIPWYHRLCGYMLKLFAPLL
jgi:cardiolipin synthase